MKPFELLTRETARKLRCIPAMATVFKANGFGQEDAPIDFLKEGQEKLIEFLIKGGVDAILVCGTTGEAATLTRQEQISLISWTVGIVNGRVPVIAGCGSNCTREAVKLTKEAMNVGANAALHVKPYYNKPGWNGLLAHYQAIAEVGLPFISYSVSSRHGGDAIPVGLIAELAAACPLFIGHKEAEGESARFSQLRQACPKDFVIWSGDDGITAEVMGCGHCDGVISVAANVVPDLVKKMVNYLANSNGEPNDAKADGFALGRKLADLFGKNGLFIETNPQPVKTALRMIGVIDRACFRLPLVPMEEGNAKKLRQVLAELGLVKAAA